MAQMLLWPFSGFFKTCLTLCRHLGVIDFLMTTHALHSQHNPTEKHARSSTADNWCCHHLWSQLFLNDVYFIYIFIYIRSTDLLKKSPHLGGTWVQVTNLSSHLLILSVNSVVIWLRARSDNCLVTLIGQLQWCSWSNISYNFSGKKQQHSD